MIINIGQFNKMKVVREADFGYYLDRGTRNTSDDILIPTGNLDGREIKVGDEVEAFIYRDSRDRLIATLKKPLAVVGDVALYGTHYPYFVMEFSHCDCTYYFLYASIITMLLSIIKL